MTIEEMAAKSCQPCRNTLPMNENEARLLLRDLPGWAPANNSIEKEFRFKSYKAGLDYAYSIGMLAEKQDHHPDITVRWRRVKLSFSTHSIRGLSMNDFIMAARSELEFGKFTHMDTSPPERW